MGEKLSYFNLVSAQRYFHLVAFKVNDDADFTINSYWRNCGLDKKVSPEVQEHVDFRIEHSRVVSDLPFYNGQKDFSLNGDGSPPFNYDLFIIHIIKENVLVMGFPFKLFAKMILSNLIKNGLLSKGSFLRCDLTSLLKLRKENISYSEDFSSIFSALELILSGDTNITTVILDGDNPLDSLLYKQYFEDRINNDQCMLDKCSLKCETINISPRTRSNIHVDVNGNYKLYVHGSGNNLFTIPFLFKSLNLLGCLRSTIINPITKLKDE